MRFSPLWRCLLGIRQKVFSGSSARLTDRASSRDPIALVCRTYLRPGQTWLPRHADALRRFRPVIFARKVLSGGERRHEVVSLSHRAWLLRFILRSHEARLAHIHFLWNAVWFFDLWRKPTIPVLVTAHGSDVNNAFEDPRYGGRVRRALGAADAIVCVSRFIKERLMALGCPEDKLIVNPLGVPVPKIDACGREGRDRTSSAVNLVCVAALREEKGHMYLLDAFRKVRDCHPGVRLDLAGDGPLRGPILRQIRAMGLDECVRLLGWLNEEEVFRLMRESDICVQSSVRDVVKGKSHREEGLPLSLVEAAAAGLPIAASRVGGIPEICRHGLNGLLSEERDADAMAGNILALIGDPDMRRRFGDRGRGIVRAEFDERTSVDRLESLYEDRIAAAGHRERR